MFLLYLKLKTLIVADKAEKNYWNSVYKHLYWVGYEDDRMSNILNKWGDRVDIKKNKKLTICSWKFRCFFFDKTDAL